LGDPPDSPETLTSTQFAAILALSTEENRLKHPLRRIELRSARSALDWRNGVAIWRFGAANRRGRARSRLPVARNDPDKDGNHPDEFTITRKQPRIGRIMRGEYE